MASPLDDKHSLRLVKAKGRYHAHIEGLAVHGSGDSAETAITAVTARYEELQTFSRETGLSLAMMAGAGSSKPARRSGLWAAALVVVCFGLMMVPLSYALSTALERSLSNLDLKGGRQFWTGLEDGLINAADAKNAPDPEKQARSAEALHTMALRLKPYADAIRPLFAEPAPHESAKDPTAK